jgi:hypothetical protein
MGEGALKQITLEKVIGVFTIGLFQNYRGLDRKQNDRFLCFLNWNLLLGHFFEQGTGQHLICLRVSKWENYSRPEFYIF